MFSSRFFVLLIRHPPPSTLFPYTTLFRSDLPGFRKAALALEDRHQLAGLLCQLPQATHNTPQARAWGVLRSEEHTSELQSRVDLVCRLLLEKKKKKKKKKYNNEKNETSNT